MPLHEMPALRRAVEKGLRPVPGRMKSDPQPERTGEPQQEAVKQRTDHYPDDAHDGLTGIGNMSGAEKHGDKDGGRPETQSARQGCLQIAAEHHLFSYSYQQEDQQPNQAVSKY